MLKYKAMAQKTEKATIEKTDEEWRRMLTPEKFHVLREHGTERPGASPLNHEKRSGTFVCAGCGQPLFSSDTKFESGTGWPSFWGAVEHAVETSTDDSLFMRRGEADCARCGGHPGPAIAAGPPPNRPRFCLDGAARAF